MMMIILVWQKSMATDPTKTLCSRIKHTSIGRRGKGSAKEGRREGGGEDDLF
jgi:hypothetical protein